MKPLHTAHLSPPGCSPLTTLALCMVLSIMPSTGCYQLRSYIACRPARPTLCLDKCCMSWTLPSLPSCCPIWQSVFTTGPMEEGTTVVTGSHCHHPLVGEISPRECCVVLPLTLRPQGPPSRILGITGHCKCISARGVTHSDKLHWYSNLFNFFPTGEGSILGAKFQF